MNSNADITAALEQMERDLERLAARRKARPASAAVKLPASAEVAGRPAWLFFVLVCLGACAGTGGWMNLPALQAAALVGTLIVIAVGWPAGRPGSSERTTAKIAAIERRVEALARGGAAAPGIDEDITSLRTIVRSLLACVAAEPSAEASR